MEHAEAGSIGRHHGGVVLDEVAKLGILFLADRRFQGNGLLADLLDLAHALGGKAHLLADLLGRWLATELLQKLALDAHELVDGFHHVNRDADGTRLVGDGAGDGLADPPRGVRGELEALRVVELLDGADQAQVAFLDKVQEQHAAADIALGDGHDQSQVRLDELLLGIDAHLLHTAQTALLAALELAALLLGLVKLSRGGDAGFDLHGQVDLLGGAEQRDLADFLQVHAHRVASEHGDVGGLVALAHRAAGLLRAHLGQRHIGSGLELLLGDALEQVLFLAVLVDVGLRLLVGCRFGAAHIGLDVVDVQHVLVLKHLFDHRGGSGRLRGFRGLGSGCLVLRSLSHVFFLSTG